MTLGKLIDKLERLRDAWGDAEVWVETSNPQGEDLYDDFHRRLVDEIYRDAAIIIISGG